MGSPAPKPPRFLTCNSFLYFFTMSLNSVVVNRMDSEAKWPGFESWLTCLELLTLGKFSVNLCLSILIYKTDAK